MSKTVEIRSIFSQGDGGVRVTLDDDEEVVGADHEGNNWWVYVTKYKMQSIPDTVHIGKNIMDGK